jgi:hypothetical protein
MGRWIALTFAVLVGFVLVQNWSDIRRYRRIMTM